MSNENEITSPYVQAAVEALNNKSNFEFGPVKVSEKADLLEYRGTPPVPAPASSGSGGSRRATPRRVGTVERMPPIDVGPGKLAKAGKALKVAGKVATPLVAGYGAYQGWNVDPNAGKVDKSLNAAQGALATLDPVRVASDINQLSTEYLGRSIPGMDPKKDYYLIPEPTKDTAAQRRAMLAGGVASSSQTPANAAAPATPAPKPLNRRNIRGVQDRINRDKALDAAAQDRVAGLTPGSMSGKPPKVDVSKMSDEQRYGKTGAEIIRLGGMEAYKNRPKTAAGNLELLNKLRAKTSSGADDLQPVTVTARRVATQPSQTTFSPSLAAAQMPTPAIATQKIEPVKVGRGVFLTKTGEKTALRKAIPNELVNLFKPKPKTPPKATIGEQSDALANELLGFEAAKGVKVKGREKILGKPKKPLPLPRKLPPTPPSPGSGMRRALPMPLPSPDNSGGMVGAKPIGPLPPDNSGDMVGAKPIFPGKKPKPSLSDRLKKVRTPVVPTKRTIGEQKLDPIGREDKDVNNDGDVNKTDVYLANRRAKIGKAIAKRLGK